MRGHGTIQAVSVGVQTLVDRGEMHLQPDTYLHH